MEIRPILSALMRSKTGAVLLALQVALSLAILVNALYIVNVRQAAAQRPSGVADESAIFAVILDNLKPGGVNQQLAIGQRITASLRALAGVASVANARQLPLSGSGMIGSLRTEPGQARTEINASTYASPDSLVQTWGLKLIAGRDFRPDEVIDVDRNDDDALPQVLIVTRALAEKAWPGAASVLGKTVYFGSDAKAATARVVGVVAALQTPNAEADARAEYSLLMPIRHLGGHGAIYTVRTEPGQRERVMREVDAALRAAAVGPLVVRTETMQEQRAKRYRADLALSWMLIGVSALLLLVTASGIVGISSLWVAQRRKQIGVRRALGARRIDILRYFITENILITSAGVAAGALLALALNELLVSQLELGRLPPAYIGAGAAVFWALGLAAVYGPAWRAASISPASATRGA
ncbi:MAG TPA: ABC transporter permease [Janthinobacterium sp.]|nr:ABC transporter permease [Janthinobacterium sp.]